MKAQSELGRNAETPAETTGDAPITDVSGDVIDPVWAAEFRGFFWGEGTLAIQIQTHPKHQKSIAVAATIGLRSDDAAILEAFRDRLGGVLRTERYRDGSGRTIVRWQVGTSKDNLRIARLLDSPTGLPFRKARELALWREAVVLKDTTKQRARDISPDARIRYHPHERDRMVEIAVALKAMRLYNGSG